MRLERGVGGRWGTAGSFWLSQGGGVCDGLGLLGGEFAVEVKCVCTGGMDLGRSEGSLLGW